MTTKLEYKQNLHTHTTFCDGKDSPEELVLEAISRGFDSIGFSAHSYMNYSNALRVTLDSTKVYKREINRLKAKYRGKIKIYLGMEFDVFSNDDLTGLDYSIGAVHTIRAKDGSLMAFDGPIGLFEKVINEGCGGEGMEFARRYYAAMEELPTRGKFDIVAHYDLVTKHRDRIKFFDENSLEYRDMAISAARKIAEHIPYFEVNVGAVSRGYRSSPYPAPFLIKEFLSLGMGAVIGTDCHNKMLLDAAFDDGISLLRECGAREIFVLGDDGFYPIKI